MLNKRSKSFGVILMAILGAVLFVYSPIFGYAQYYSQVNTYENIYTYGNNYNITTTNATNITSSSATLNGLANGNSVYSISNFSTWFEYGTNTNFGYSTLRNSSSSGYASYSSNISNLSPNTVYYFRAIAQVPQGVVYGSINSFRTNFASVIDMQNNTGNSILNVITTPVTSISSTSAQLNSLIFNQNSNSSNTWFEYGTSLTLGDITTPIATGDFSFIKHVNTLTKLAPNTTYYFRAVAVNSSSRSNGSILSFVTKSGTQSNKKIINTITPTVETGSNTNLRQFIFGANVLGTGFLPGSLFEWLFLLILILILILLTKYLFDQSSREVPSTVI